MHSILRPEDQRRSRHEIDPDRIADENGEQHGHHHRLEVLDIGQFGFVELLDILPALNDGDSCCA